MFIFISFSPPYSSISNPSHADYSSQIPDLFYDYCCQRERESLLNLFIVILMYMYLGLIS